MECKLHHFRLSSHPILIKFHMKAIIAENIYTYYEKYTYGTCLFICQVTLIRRQQNEGIFLVFEKS